MDDLVQRLRQEAARNAQMQGDKEHQTNRRRKTFRYRNHLLMKAADRLERVDGFLINALDGKPLDQIGNRDENGLNVYPDIEYIHGQILKAKGEME